MAHERHGLRDVVVTGPWDFKDFTLELESVTTDLLPIDHANDHSTRPFDSTYGLIKLPDPESFAYGPLEDISVISASTQSDFKDDDAENDDIWAAVPFEHYDAPKKPRTWAQFRDKHIREPKLYLSEAGQETWNVAWAAGTNTTTPAIRAIRHDHVLRNLFALALGLNSRLFGFDSSSKAFARTAITISGLSESMTLSVVRTIGHCGELLRLLERLTTESQRKGKSFTAAICAIQRATRIVRKHISKKSSAAATILQLQDLVRKPILMLEALHSSASKLQQSSSDVQVINIVLRSATESESNDSWFTPIAVRLLEAAISPFLEEVSHTIGASSASAVIPIPGMDLAEKLSSCNSIELLHTVLLPDIFNDKQKQDLAQLCTALNLLRKHSPGHTLFNARGQSANASLEMVFHWEDLERIRSRARELESDLQSVLVRTGAEHEPSVPITTTIQPLVNSNPYGVDPSFLAEQIFDSVNVLNVKPNEETDMPVLEEAVLEVLESTAAKYSDEDLRPSLTFFTIESFSPIISVQSRAINAACLKMVFADHDLSHELDVLYQFSLLGSGIFTTRLKQALFSPELSSAERKKGRQRIGQLGLRLGSRSTWPPASAELRLALMGILSECYSTSFSGRPGVDSEKLPGDIAFAIRNLTEPEIEACMVSNSLQALDFLKIQYRASGALEAVITESALVKYDSIFRFLLRLNRVSFAVDQMWLSRRQFAQSNSTTTRFLIEVRHVVQALIGYVHTTIAIVWERFHSVVKTIGNEVIKASEAGIWPEIGGLHHVRSLHEATLDKIMFNLLLRQRHEKIMQILEGLLACILQVASEPKDGGMLELISTFHTKMKLFVTVCQGLSDRADYRQQEDVHLPDVLDKVWRSEERSTGGLKSLLLALDMNGWYAKQDVQS